MKGSKKVITALNKILGNELISINQTFLHSRMFNDWGMEDIGKAEYKKSIKDMKQADDLIERILFLEGLPNLQHLEKIRIGEHTKEMLQCDMEFQNEEIALLREAIACCETQQDYVTRDLLEDILGYEEEHVDWIEAQEYLIDNAGLENYLQSQM